MTVIRDVVEGFSLQEMTQIHREFEEYNESGITGESLLRIKAREIMRKISARDEKEADYIWLNVVGSEVNRRLAGLYIASRSA